MRRRVLSIFLVLLVASSGVAAPATAQTDYLGECSSLVSFIQNAAVLGLTGMQTEDCSPTNNQIEQMKQDDAAQEKIDIYQSVTASRSNAEITRTQTANTLNDSESVAWMKMQVAVAEAYQNGSSEATATIDAKQAIEDYYAVKEENILRQAETHMTNLYYLQQVAENESGISQTYIYTTTYHPDGGQYNGKAYIEDNTNQTVTLLNGDQITIEALVLRYTTSGTTQGTETYSPMNPSPSHYTGNNNLNIDSWLTVSSAGSGYESKRAIEMQQYADDLNEIQTKSSELKTEAEAFVDATYADFSSGEANASDVISANTAMFEYGTQNDENSSLYDSTAALATMGYDTPNMSNSGTMDVTHQGNTYTGILLARNAPNGSWSTNTTYNTSNITGPVFMATTDGQKVDFAEGTEFTVDQMRNRDGENIASVETTEYVYKTANTSELNDMQSQLIELREEIESREPPGSGGGSGSGIGTNAIIAGAALAGAALLYGRSNQ